jgi:hypothetical protein
MYLFDGRHGYRFTMAALDCDGFQAVSMSVNPATELPGFKAQQ